MLAEEGDRGERSAVNLQGLVVEVEEDCLRLGLGGAGRSFGGVGVFKEINGLGEILIG